MDDFKDEDDANGGKEAQPFGPDILQRSPLNLHKNSNFNSNSNNEWQTSKELDISNSGSFLKGHLIDQEVNLFMLSPAQASVVINNDMNNYCNNNNDNEM